MRAWLRLRGKGRPFVVALLPRRASEERERGSPFSQLRLRSSPLETLSLFHLKLRVNCVYKIVCFAAKR